MTTFIQPSSATFIQDFTGELQKAGPIGKFRIIRDAVQGFAVEAKGKGGGFFKSLGFGATGPKYELKSHVKLLEAIVDKDLAFARQAQNGEPVEKHSHAQLLIKAYNMLETVMTVCANVASRATSPSTKQLFSHNLVKKQKECFQTILSLIPISPVALACRLGNYEMATFLCKASWPKLPTDLSREELGVLLRFTRETNEMDLFSALYCSQDKETMNMFSYDCAFSALDYALKTKDGARAIKIIEACYQNDHDKLGDVLITLSREPLQWLCDWCIQRVGYLDKPKRWPKTWRSEAEERLFKQALEEQNLQRIDFLLQNSIRPTAEEREKIAELRAKSAFSHPDHNLLVGRKTIPIHWQYVVDTIPNMKSFLIKQSGTRLDAKVHDPQGVQDFFDSLVGTYHVEEEREVGRAFGLLYQAHRFASDRLVERAASTLSSLFEKVQPLDAQLTLLRDIRKKLNTISPNLFESRYEARLISACLSRQNAGSSIVEGLEFAEKLTRSSFSLPVAFYRQYLLEPMKLAKFIPQKDKARANHLFERLLDKLQRTFPDSLEYFEAAKDEEGLKRLQAKSALRDLYMTQNRFADVVELYKDELWLGDVDAILLAYAQKKTGKPFDRKLWYQIEDTKIVSNDFRNLLLFYFFPETQESFVRNLRNDKQEVLTSIEAYCLGSQDIDLMAPSSWEREFFDATNPFYKIIAEEVAPTLRDALMRT